MNECYVSTNHEPVGTAKAAGAEAPTKLERDARLRMKPLLLVRVNGFILMKTMAPPGLD
jgi:hypothetical protein